MLLNVGLTPRLVFFVAAEYLDRNHGNRRGVNGSSGKNSLPPNPRDSVQL